jgi:SNF2 family DNA or RNA helicase
MARDIDVILHNIDNYVVIFDEVQHLKTQRIDEPNKTRSSLYTAALKLSTKGRYVWGLSATPQMNGRLEELYSIFEVIRPGTFGSWENFKARYLEFEAGYRRVGGRLLRYPKLKGYKNIPEVMKIVRPFYLKRPSAVINKALPQVVSKQVTLEMLPDQQNLYNKLVSKHFPSLDGVHRINKLVSLTYAQLASNAPPCLGMPYLAFPSSKMVELKRFFQEEVADEKIIIYSRFRRTVDYICDNLTEIGVRHTKITGTVKTKQRDDAVLVFNNPSSGVNVICINKAGGSSLDLQQASVIIFYDLPWSWGERDQVRGRARRIGSPHEKVLELILMNMNSIDQYSWDVLEEKESLVEQGIGVDQKSLLIQDPVSRLFEMVRLNKAA